ncbi:MAG: efflux RND transporter periplasmic adaptor subunit [Ignavibacteriaceae bacterium]|nr:efflux RND transporter periplasmic adaptor subunit [Ignavibacteriaceae bacterium]
MDKKKSVKFIAIIGIALLIILLLVIPKLKEDEPAPGEVAGARKINPVVTVNAMVVRPAKLTSLFLTSGSLISNEETELRSEITGRVTEINFVEGSFVKKGTLLVKLNDAELQAQYTKNKLKKELAEDREYRERMLYERNASTKEIYDVAVNELNSIKAEMEFIQAQIVKTEIRAPFDGRVGLRNISVGSYISPTTVIATFQDSDPIKLDFSVPQKYKEYVRKGMNVRFKTPSSGRTYNASVYAIEPRIDANSRTLRVRAVSPNTGGELVAGGFVEVEISLSGLDRSLAVPTQSVTQDIKGEKIFIYKGGKAVPIQVKTGIRTDTEIQIISGIGEGDTIITSGIIQLRPGARVKIAELKH